MFTIQTGDHTLRPALLVVDVQNGFVSKGGSYDRLGMDGSNYRAERFADSSRRVQQNNGHIPKDRIDNFIQTFNLLDPRKSI